MYFVQNPLSFRLFSQTSSIVDVWLGSKYVSEVSIIVYFPIPNSFQWASPKPHSWCWHTVCITVALLDPGDSGARNVVPGIT